MRRRISQLGLSPSTIRSFIVYLKNFCNYFQCFLQGHYSPNKCYNCARNCCGRYRDESYSLLFRFKPYPVASTKLLSTNPIFPQNIRTENAIIAQIAVTGSFARKQLAGCVGHCSYSGKRTLARFRRRNRKPGFDARPLSFAPEQRNSTSWAGTAQDGIDEQNRIQRAKTGILRQDGPKSGRSDARARFFGSVSLESAAGLSKDKGRERPDPNRRGAKTSADRQMGVQGNPWPKRVGHHGLARSHRQRTQGSRRKANLPKRLSPDARQPPVLRKGGLRRKNRGGSAHCADLTQPPISGSPLPRSATQAVTQSPVKDIFLRRQDRTRPATDVW